MRLLGQAARYCLYLVIGLIGVRLLLWGVLDALSPSVRLALDALTLGLLLIGVLGAAFGGLPQHRSNSLVWLGLVLGFPVIFVIERDFEDWQIARLWTADARLASAGPAGDARPDIILSRRANGHYHIDASYNGVSVDFLVDTGATNIALTLDDARRLGVREDRLVYDVQVATASGTDFGAPVILPYLDIHGERFERVPALVLRGGGQSLLGMSIIGAFSAVEIRDDRLILRR